MKINCIIVDDEPASREILERYIQDTPNLKLVHICNNAFEANEIIANHKVQLFFLDINMPKLSGMEFYRSLTNPPLVIFTTAYSEYAVEGFDVGAVDYLLKPFPFERFLRAVNKACEIIKEKTSEFSDNSFILLKSEKKMHRIIIDDIAHFESIGDYVKVFYNDKCIIVHETLQGILNQLPKNKFMQVHKSHIISLLKFDVVVGQTYRNDFLQFIKRSH